MIFISNAEGTIVKVAPSSIQQGTNEGNEIILFAPFVGSVQLLCILPNGMRADPINMTPLFELENTELVGLPDSFKSEYIGKSVWRVLIPYAVTEYPGVLQVQFKITIPNANKNKSPEIKTSTLNVYINPGYYTEEETPDETTGAGIASLAAEAAKGYEANARTYSDIAQDWATGKVPKRTLNGTEMRDENDNIITKDGSQAKNNAQYYAEQAGKSAGAASGSAIRAGDSAEAASGSATQAGESAGAAAGSAAFAEAWAVGTVKGEDVQGNSDTYPHKNNNAKHYATEAGNALSEITPMYEYTSDKYNQIVKLDEKIAANKTRAEEAAANAEKIYAKLTKIMTFRGPVTERPTDLSNYQDGDVIAVTDGIDKGKEFVLWEGDWIELGDTSAEHQSIAALQTGKQDKLPENDGGSSHRVWVASPLGYTDENGEKKPGFELTESQYNDLKEEFPDYVKIVNEKYYWTHPYYLKRINGYNGTGKGSSNGDTGIVTKANRDTKVAEGIISKTDGVYNNYIEHDEPTNISIACRDSDGRLVVEDGEKDFHAVNKRQLDKVRTNLDSAIVEANTTIEKLSKNIFSSVKNIFTLTDSNSQGWYRIASVTKGSGIPSSAIFKVTANVQSGGFWSEIIFIASRAFTAEGKILVLNHQMSHNGKAIDNIRIGYKTTAQASPAYVDVHCVKNSSSATDTVKISVELLENVDTTNAIGSKWTLLTPEKESDTEPYEYARVETVDDIFGISALIESNAKKLDAYTNSGNLNKVYVAKKGGTQSTYDITTGYDANTVMMRDGNGASEIVTPDEPKDTHIANVGYVKENGVGTAPAYSVLIGQPHAQNVGTGYLTTINFNDCKSTSNIPSYVRFNDGSVIYIESYCFSGFISEINRAINEAENNSNTINSIKNISLNVENGKYSFTLVGYDIFGSDYDETFTGTAPTFNNPPVEIPNGSASNVESAYATVFAGKAENRPYGFLKLNSSGDIDWYRLPYANNAIPGAVHSVPSGDVNITNGVITVKDNSHKHTTSNITGLDGELDNLSARLTKLDADFEEYVNERVTVSDYCFDNPNINGAVEFLSAHLDGAISNYIIYGYNPDTQEKVELLNLDLTNVWYEDSPESISIDFTGKSIDYTYTDTFYFITRSGSVSFDTDLYDSNLYLTNPFPQFMVSHSSGSVYIKYLKRFVGTVVALEKNVQTLQETNNNYDHRLSYLEGGVAILDENGKIPCRHLPSYVDDIIEGTYDDSDSSFKDVSGSTITGESGKIYVDTTTNKSYRWSGSAYVEISSSLSIGENESTAFDGKRGLAAYNHSLLESGNPHNVTKSDLGLENVENKSSAVIRGELTKDNVTSALGYTPPTEDAAAKWNGYDIEVLTSTPETFDSNTIYFITEE